MLTLIRILWYASVDGNHRGPVSSYRAQPSAPTRQGQPLQPASAQRVVVRGRAGVQVAGLPKRFGNGHTIYTRMNRWSKNGVLDRVFEQLQREQIVRIKSEAVKLDSTTVKVHPDGMGA